MAKIVIFASGNGSNFEAIAEKFINDKENKIELLICNNKNAYVLERANKLGIPYEIVIYQKENCRNTEAEIIEIIKKYKVDVIFLAGYMKILSSYFLKNTTIPIINIHPSLLPKYKGVNAIEKAFNSNDNEIGITIHYVVEEVDSGEIILQKEIFLDRDKGLEYVEKEVHKLEHNWYPIVAKEICDKINKKNN